MWFSSFLKTALTDQSGLRRTSCFLLKATGHFNRDIAAESATSGLAGRQTQAWFLRFSRITRQPFLRLEHELQVIDTLDLFPMDS